MANRREVLQAGVAASALWATGVAASLRPVWSRRASLGLECLVCDERFADSMAAARAARRQGLAVHRTSGDMTELWYGRLDALWRRRPAAIAGVTGEDALFVLERLGWDRGLRVIYRGRHVRIGNGDVRHRLEGAQGLVEMMTSTRGGAWTDRFAAALAACSADVGSHHEVRWLEDEAQRMRGDEDEARFADGGGALISWLMTSVPYARARS